MKTIDGLNFGKPMKAQEANEQTKIQKEIREKELESFMNLPIKEQILKSIEMNVNKGMFFTSFPAIYITEEIRTWLEDLDYVLTSENSKTVDIWW